MDGVVNRAALSKRGSFWGRIYRNFRGGAGRKSKLQVGLIGKGTYKRTRPEETEGKA